MYIGEIIANLLKDSVIDGVLDFGKGLCMDLYYYVKYKILEALNDMES